MQRAHVVQAVGELDEQHAHVGRDGEEEFSEILALGGAFRDEVEALDLGEAVDEFADLRPEGGLDLLERGGRILDRVVQHRRRDGGVVELEVGQDRRDFEGVAEVKVAGGALLGAVRPHGVDVGPVEKRFVGGGVIPLDPLDELVLTHHPDADSPISAGV
jgi:hypothetical protein